MCVSDEKRDSPELKCNVFGVSSYSDSYSVHCSCRRSGRADGVARLENHWLGSSQTTERPGMPTLIGISPWCRWRRNHTRHKAQKESSTRTAPVLPPSARRPVCRRRQTKAKQLRQSRSHLVTWPTMIQWWPLEGPTLRYGRGRRDCGV